MAPLSSPPWPHPSWPCLVHSCILARGAVPGTQTRINGFNKLALPSAFTSSANLSATFGTGKGYKPIQQVRKLRLRKIRRVPQRTEAGCGLQSECCEAATRTSLLTRKPACQVPIFERPSLLLPLPALKPAVLTWAHRVEDVDT